MILPQQFTQPIQPIGTPPHKNSDITNNCNSGAEENRKSLSGRKEEGKEKRGGNREKISMNLINIASPTPLQRVGDIDSTLRAQLLVSNSHSNVFFFIFYVCDYFKQLLSLSLLLLLLLLSSLLLSPLCFLFLL